jgi:predicted MFS family arabinose efflux permease
MGILVFVSQVPRTLVVQRNRETLADISQIGQLLKNPILLRLNLGIFCLHMALMAAFVVIPTILADEMGIADSDLWWVYAALLGGGFVAMIPAMILGERHQQQKLTFVSAVAVLAVSMLVLGLQRGALLTPIMLLLFFAAFNLLEASLPSWLSKVCPAGSRGTAMGIYSTCQFFGAFAGGALGGWSLQYYGVSGLLLLIAGVLGIWWILALGLQSPRALQTLVLQVGDTDHQDFAKIISTITGVEDILLIEGEQLAYIKVDKQRVDMQSLKPYFNRTDT